MSTDNIDPSKKDTTISSADDLVKTNKADVELSEEELKRVSGGLKDPTITVRNTGKSQTGF
jgi:bacteriocin-like protein